MGADIYLTKPFQVELHKPNIDHCLNVKRTFELLNRKSLHYHLLHRKKTTISLRRVMNTIEANIANAPKCGLISDEIGMSSTHLYRKLKSLTHFSAKALLKNRGSTKGK
jgi:hypothetical protein